MMEEKRRRGNATRQQRAGNLMQQCVVDAAAEILGYDRLEMGDRWQMAERAREREDVCYSSVTTSSFWDIRQKVSPVIVHRILPENFP